MAKLFTPGPLNTTESVKQTMLHDLGSRDTQFVTAVRSICTDLIKVVHGNPKEHAAIPLQGAGSYAVEAVFANVIGRSHGKALICANGAYAYRMVAMCEQAGYNHKALLMPEHQPLDLNAFYFVDAMSSLGAVPLDMGSNNIHFVVSSANKCLQGVPGFAYILAERGALQECQGNCTSWSFDLCAQLKGLETNGQFRCTPPTHVILAFRQALDEFHIETAEGRMNRYKANNNIIRTQMKLMGFTEFDEHVNEERRGYIITAFHYPDNEQFDFTTMYKELSKRGLVIYPGKVSKADTFRLGNIGDLHADDCEQLMSALKEVLQGMGVALPVSYD